MKKLNVNTDACIGCGACVAIDGTHFDFDENGLSEVISNENVETEECQNAIASCPTNAISYVDGCDNENCHCENCSCEDCSCESEECHCNHECSCENK